MEDTYPEFLQPISGVSNDRTSSIYTRLSFERFSHDSGRYVSLSTLSALEQSLYTNNIEGVLTFAGNDSDHLHIPSPPRSVNKQIERSEAKMERTKSLVDDPRLIVLYKLLTRSKSVDDGVDPKDHE